MNNIEKEDTRRQIRNLLTVIGSGIFAAFLITAFFIWNYGPSGRYEILTTLLAPHLLHELDYNDTNPKTGGFDRFIFDRIIFSYISPNDKSWRKTTVSESEYAQFYEMIKNDKSVLNPPDEVTADFMREPIAELAFIVKTESPAAWQAVEKTFQEVQFAKNDNYFRIELHEQNPGEHWAYFYHPGIVKEAFRLFAH